MADDGKRVEVRMGSFACTIEGYDDPIDKLKEVMSLVQQMISETPALVDVSAEVDNAEVQEALDSEPVRVRNTSQDTTDAKTGDATPDMPEDVPEAARQPEQPTDKSETDGDFTLAAADAADRIRTPAAPVDTATPPEPDPFAAFVAEDAPATDTSDAAAADEADTPTTSDDVEVEVAAATPDAAAAPTDPTPPRSEATPDETRDASATTTPAPLRAPATDSTTSGRKLYGMGRFAASIAAGRNRKTSERDLGQPMPDPQEAADTGPDFEFAPDPVPDPVPEAAELRIEPDAAHSEDLMDLNDDVGVNIFASDLDYDAPVSDRAAWDQSPPDTADVTTAEAITNYSDYDGDADDIAAGDQDADDTASAFSAPDAFDTPKDDDGPATDANADADGDTNLFRSPDLSALEPTGTTLSSPPAADDRDDVSIAEKPASGSKVGNVFRSLFGARGRSEAAEQFDATHDAVASTTDADDADEADEADETFTNIFASDDDANARATPDTGGARSEPPAHDIDVAPERSGAGIVDEPESRPELRAPGPEESVVNIFASDADEAPLELRPEYARAPEQQPDSSTTDARRPDQPDNGDPNRFGALLERLQTERDEPAAPHMPAPGEPSETSDIPPEAAGITAAELAELSGATSVSDMLAASAAWLTLTAGKLRFSRRDVMDVFDGLPGDHPKTLEARIKGYGKLVRSGTLVLIDDGQFALAQTERERFANLLA